MNVNKRKPRYVFAIKRDGKVYRYMARINISFKRIYLGCFKTQGEAVAAVEKYFENPKRYEGRLK
jgi:hypothetical protein